MTRKTISVLSSMLLILALLAAPVACAMPGMVDAPVVAEVPECGGGCCHDMPEEPTTPDCCSSDLPGCPLPCCSGLTCMATGPAVDQEPGAAVPSGFAADQFSLPIVSPRPIEHPPRS